MRKADQQKVGTSLIHGHRHVPQDGHAQQGFHIRIMRLGGEGIPEEDQEVHAALGDLRANLKVAPERPAQEAAHRQPQFLFQKTSRSARGAEGPAWSCSRCFCAQASRLSLQ